MALEAATFPTESQFPFLGRDTVCDVSTFVWTEPAGGTRYGADLDVSDGRARGALRSRYGSIRSTVGILEGKSGLCFLNP